MLIEGHYYCVRENEVQFEGRVVVALEETEKGRIIKSVLDIADSAGALSKYADPRILLVELIKTREESFR